MILLNFHSEYSETTTHD